MTEFDRNILKHKLTSIQNAIENLNIFMCVLDEDSRRSLAMYSHSAKDFLRDVDHTFQVIKRSYEEATHDNL